MRLDRFLSNARGIGRRRIKKIIRKGSVAVNNRVVKDPSFTVGNEDEVRLNGELITLKGKIYIALNKPSGYTCTTSDREPSVLNLVDHPYVSKLHIAGRLDKDVEGLVILTNDGNFTHRLISPKYHVEKEYHIEVEQNLTKEMIERAAAGIKFLNYTFRPATVKQLERGLISLIITEGKYHQVKNMMRALGLDYLKITRVRIGPIRLGNLKKTQWKELTEEQVSHLLETIFD